jgi:hypothetical protein
MVFLTLAVRGSAQTQPGDDIQITPGITMRQDGVIDIGVVYVEVNYYDSKWTIAQQHDRFKPSADGVKSESGAHVISGKLTTAGGDADLTERVEVAKPGDVKFGATLASDKALDTNELSMAFILPLASFGGKELTIDQQAVSLSNTAPAKGAAQIFEKDQAHEVKLPTPNGTLVVSGDFKLLLQDDREWGDPRYSMRLYFTPGSGQITQSKIDLHMVLKTGA